MHVRSSRLLPLIAWLLFYTAYKNGVRGNDRICLTIDSNSFILRGSYNAILVLTSIGGVLGDITTKDTTEFLVGVWRVSCVRIGCIKSSGLGAIWSSSIWNRFGGIYKNRRHSQRLWLVSISSILPCRFSFDEMPSKDSRIRSHI